MLNLERQRNLWMKRIRNWEVFSNTCKSHVSENGQVRYALPDVDELQVDTNDNIPADHSNSLEHRESDSQDIQVNSVTLLASF